VTAQVQLQQNLQKILKPKPRTFFTRLQGFEQRSSTIAWGVMLLLVEIDRYIGRYLGFNDISVSAKTANFISLSRCLQYAVTFLTHPDNLRKKAQWSKSAVILQ